MTKAANDGPPPFVSHGGDLMCLLGEFSPEGAREAVAVIKNNNIKRIFIHSDGGSVDGAIDVAEAIYPRSAAILPA